ncbi:MAG: PIN domain-containing protein [Candidatus Baldrarchaeia archaeon]
MRRVVLDTGVLVEYIDRKGRFHGLAAAVMGSIISGKLTGVVPHPVLTEAYYVSARIYRVLGLEDFEKRAKTYVEWLFRHPNIVVEPSGLELAIEAGKIKMKYGLALTDCYVLALSKMRACPAVFRKVEREMEGRLDELRRNFRIVFLEEYV